MPSRAVLERILNPAPGSALERAAAYGIDLTLIARNAFLTPQEQLDRAVQMQQTARDLKELRETAKRTR